ncbi:penicillin-binding protein 2 [Patescibacteria group bacterium]|nr:MAG: penicillin-binding protein 2 [Patescibacteria group bacterium]
MRLDSRQTLNRIRFLLSVIFLVACVLVGKLYFVQIVRGDQYSERADRQYARPNQNTFDRGNIYFEAKDGGRVSVASVKEGFTLVINPKLLVDAEKAYTALKPIVPTLERESFLQKSLKKDDPYEEIMKRVSKESGTKISELAIPGVQVYKERWRVYPAQKLASHTVGFIGYRANDETLAGRYGLERSYEGVLTRNTNDLYVNFFAEIFSNIKKSISTETPLEGDIVATIEPTVQNAFEGIIQKMHTKWNSELSGGIIIDPKTGEIYALAVYPTFDPNALQNEKNSDVFTNPLVESVYEMGSIIKPITMSIGLDTGRVTATTTYNDEGFLIFNNKKISNYDLKGRGPKTSMQEVLNQSLNTGAAFVMGQVGKDSFSRYMLDFGLGESTGIDLPNEAKDLVQNLKSTRDIEHATAAYGQGIAMTPIATVRALSALGNGGFLISPHIVKEIHYSVGISKKIEPTLGKSVIKKETSTEITRMLVQAFDTGLLGGAMKMDRYSIAAKTGTAQIANPQGGGYYDDRNLHSFFGYFPAYNPRFLVFLYTVYPKGAKFASETLVQPFMDTTKFLITYYEIPPDR